MKKLQYFIALLVIVMVATIVHAGLDVSGDTYTTLAVATSATNGTTETSAVDVSALKGGAKVIVFDSGDVGSYASTQQVVVVQTSTTGTSSWTNVTAPVFADTTTSATTESETLDTQTVSKYLRLKITLNGTNTVQHYFGGTIVSPR